MTIETIFAIWDWPTAVGLVLVGLVVGMILLPLAWPDRSQLTPSFPVAVSGVLSASIGLIFFVFLWLFREMAGTQFAERTISSGCQWLVFAAAMTMGLKLRDRITS